MTWHYLGIIFPILIQYINIIKADRKAGSSFQQEFKSGIVMEFNKVS